MRANLEPRRIAVISAGLGQPSATRLLADRLTLATEQGFASRGIPVQTEFFELRDVAHDIMNAMLLGFPSPALDAIITAVTTSDGLIVATPTFNSSYSGLFKSFFDVIDSRALEGMPTLIAATAGTPRHSLVLDFALRPLFTYLHAVVAPTGVFAATDDWGAASAGGVGEASRPDRLANRIDRASAELVDLVSVRDRSAVDGVLAREAA